MKASDLLVQCLEVEGVETIFGVPGEENADFMLSLEASEQIKFILTRHEQGAAFMAEVYGRLTGHVAGCLGTLGPGATNLITGVADSNMDRAPMLVLTAQGSTARLHKESHQIMDVVGAHKMWIARHYQCHEPNTCLIPNGFCSMGFVLPADLTFENTDWMQLSPAFGWNGHTVNRSRDFVGVLERAFGRVDLTR